MTDIWITPPRVQLWTCTRDIDACACRPGLAEITPPPVHLVQKTIQTLQNTIQTVTHILHTLQTSTIAQTLQTWPRRIVSNKNVKQITPCQNQCFWSLSVLNLIQKWPQYQCSFGHLLSKKPPVLWLLAMYGYDKWPYRNYQTPLSRVNHVQNTVYWTV